VTRTLAAVLSCVALAAVAATTAHELAGTSWRLARFTASDGRVLVPRESQSYTIAFAEEGTLAARVACNRGGASWTSSAPGQLALGPLTLTKKGCPADPLQQRLVKDWANVRSYVLKDGRLHVSLLADGGVYEFESLPAR
jgi:para-nitrobenzyl esterase